MKCTGVIYVNIAFSWWENIKDKGNYNLVSSSNHNSIPSPQCALGTTPPLSVRKKAKGGKETEDIKRKKEEGGEGEGQNMGRMTRKKDRNREIIGHIYDTRRKRHNIHDKTPKGWCRFKGLKGNRGLTGRRLKALRMMQSQRMWSEPQTNVQANLALCLSAISFE